MGTRKGQYHFEQKEASWQSQTITSRQQSRKWPSKRVFHIASPNSSPKYISCISMTPINSSLTFRYELRCSLAAKEMPPRYIKIVASWRYNHQVSASIQTVWTQGSKVQQRKRAYHNSRTWMGDVAKAVKDSRNRGQITPQILAAELCEPSNPEDVLRQKCIIAYVPHNALAQTPLKVAKRGELISESSKMLAPDPPNPISRIVLVFRKPKFALLTYNVKYLDSHVSMNLRYPA